METTHKKEALVSWSCIWQKCCDEFIQLGFKNLFRQIQIQTQIELAVFVQTANCLRQMSAN